tara:strand:+ start:1385 stop:1570 length:186 start_codon:yes stop_codon:yes gene_type:complete
MNNQLKNVTRFKNPVLDRDGKVVYGLYENRPVYNPDFKWPKHLRREGDVWICGETDQIETH